MQFSFLFSTFTFYLEKDTSRLARISKTWSLEIFEGTTEILSNTKDRRYIFLSVLDEYLTTSGLYSLSRFAFRAPLTPRAVLLGRDLKLIHSSWKTYGNFPSVCSFWRIRGDAWRVASSPFSALQTTRQGVWEYCLPPPPPPPPQP